MSSSSSDVIEVELLPEEYNEYDITFKIIVLGDAGVGKSCLVSKASKGVFEDSYSPTLGFEFLVFNVKINGKIIKLQIWDTCGEELYRSLITSFYRNSSLAIMVYAINDKQSFANISAWLKEVKLLSYPDIKIFLVGNKADLKKERKVDIKEAKTFVEQNDIHYFNETSAKTGLNSKEVFVEAARILYNDFVKYKGKKREMPGKNGNDVPIPVKFNNKDNRKKGGCCG